MNNNKEGVRTTTREIVNFSVPAGEDVDDVLTHKMSAEIVNQERSGLAGVVEHLSRFSDISGIKPRELQRYFYIQEVEEEVVGSVQTRLTCYLKFKLPDELADLLESQEKLSNLYGVNDFMFELIRFEHKGTDDENFSIQGYDEVLSTLVTKGRISDEQKPTLASLILGALHSKVRTGKARHVEFVEKQSEVKTVVPTQEKSEPKLTQEPGNAVVEGNVLDELSDVGKNLLREVDNLPSGNQEAFRALERRAKRAEVGVSEVQRELPGKVVESRPERHAGLRQATHQGTEQKGRDFRRVDSGPPGTKGLVKVEEEGEEAQSGYIDKRLIFAVIVTLAILAGHAFVGLKLADYRMEVWQNQEDLFLTIFGSQVGISILIAAIKTTIKTYREEIKDNSQILSNFAKNFFLWSIVTTAASTVWFGGKTAGFDFLVGNLQIEHLPIDEQIKLVKEWLKPIFIFAGGIGAVATILGLVTLMSKREKKNKVDVQKEQEQKPKNRFSKLIRRSKVNKD